MLRKFFPSLTILQETDYFASEKVEIIWIVKNIRYKVHLVINLRLEKSNNLFYSYRNMI